MRCDCFACRRSGQFVEDAHVAFEVRLVAEAAEAHGTSGFALVHGKVADARAVRVKHPLADAAHEVVLPPDHFDQRRRRSLRLHRLPCNFNALHSPRIISPKHQTGTVSISILIHFPHFGSFYWAIYDKFILFSGLFFILLY